MSTPQQITTYTLPPALTPETLETLPVLRTILERLSIPSSSSSNSTQTQPTSQPSQTSPPPISTPSQQPPPSTASSSLAPTKDGTGPLLLKDIPQATDGLRHKIQRARAQVKELPDVERSIEEQEEEIRELEEKIRLQKAVLSGLRARGAGIQDLKAGREVGLMDTGS